MCNSLLRVYRSPADHTLDAATPEPPQKHIAAIRFSRQKNRTHHFDFAAEEEPDRSRGSCVESPRARVPGFVSMKKQTTRRTVQRAAFAPVYRPNYESVLPRIHVGMWSSDNIEGRREISESRRDEQGGAGYGHRCAVQGEARQTCRVQVGIVR